MLFMLYSVCCEADFKKKYSNMSDLKFFHMNHGASFLSNGDMVVYAEGECTLKELDTDLLNVEDIKDEVMNLGYSE